MVDFWVYKHVCMQVRGGGEIQGLTTETSRVGKGGDRRGHLFCYNEGAG